MEEKQKWWKKLSIFQITCIVLIAILIIVVIVQIGIMIDLKNKTDDTNDKNDDIVSQLPEEEQPETEETTVLCNYSKIIENHNNSK